VGPAKAKCILGVETSCDDTGLALFQNGQIIAFQKRSQVIHSSTKGVIPQIAAKEHFEQINHLFENCLKEGMIASENIRSIGVTCGPGLIGALAVGASWAAGLGESLRIPVYGVNHLEGHVFTLFLSEEKPKSFPILVLLASGGHTMLLNWSYPDVFKCIFNTRDDSAGEAFDKIARILGLGFPGGPDIELHAERSKNKKRYKFTVPMRNRSGFSFSGLKTEARKKIKESKNINVDDFCASFQDTAFKHLLEQTSKELRLGDYKGLGLVGGVSANKRLRSEFEYLAEKHSLQFVVPPLKLSTDNGVMPAIVAEKMSRGEIEAKELSRIFSRFTSLE